MIVSPFALIATKLNLFRKKEDWANKLKGEGTFYCTNISNQLYRYIKGIWVVLITSMMIFTLCL